MTDEVNFISLTPQISDLHLQSAQYTTSYDSNKE